MELLNCFECHLLRLVQPVSALPLFDEGTTFRQQHHNLIDFARDLFPTLERGWDMLNVAVSEFGSNRKNRGNGFKTVIQYSLDMEQALRGL